MIASVSHAMAIFQYLSSQAVGVSASEICEATGTEKSMVSRVLETLEREKYVIKSSSGQYFVGLKFVSMGIQQLEVTGFTQLCSPFLRRIADHTGELVQLAIADSEGLHYVAKAASKDRIRVEPRLGTRPALHATAVGKVWLASLPEKDALKLALNAGLEAFTDSTITTVDKLRAELSRVRRAGFAFNHGEAFPGLKGIAVPVFGNGESMVVGAIVIVAPSFRMSDTRAKSFLPLLKSQAESLRGVECLASDDRPAVSQQDFPMAS